MTSSNPLLRSAVIMLERASKAKKAPIWNEASKMLGAPTGLRVEVNIGRISRIAAKDSALFVPGKVLGSGLLDKKVVVGAFSFSAAAKKKIESTGGSAMTVEQFLKKYPDGSGVKLVQ
ncbi:MAG TPA: 50S ribosomal protein L18e [Nitrososphaerales archaeon]|nr:50S ribosomal protein L18e [Nitrososphaerales archaeon]